MHKGSNTNLKIPGTARPVWQLPSVLAFKQGFLGTSTSFQVSSKTSFPFSMYYTLNTASPSCRARSGAALSQPGRGVQAPPGLAGCRVLWERSGLRRAGRAINPHEQPHPSVLTHCCGQRASKARRSFSHSAAPSPCLSRHCQNSSRAPQHAFLSSIVGAAIPAAHSTRRLSERSPPCPRRRAPGKAVTGTEPRSHSPAREGRAPETIPPLVPPHRLSLPSLVRPSPPPVPPRGAGTDLPHLPEGFPPSRPRQGCCSLSVAKDVRKYELPDVLSCS